MYICGCVSLNLDMRLARRKSSSILTILRYSILASQSISLYLSLQYRRSPAHQGVDMNSFYNWVLIIEGKWKTIKLYGEHIIIIAVHGAAVSA